MKRGFFYSLIVVLLLAPIVFLVLTGSEFSSSSEKETKRKFVGQELANFASSVENDFPRALEISAKSAVVALVAEVVSGGSPASNATQALRSLLFNKTYEGVTSGLMGNNSLTEWIQRLNAKSRFFGLTSNVSLGDLIISERNGFELLFNASLIVHLVNREEGINLSRTYWVLSVVSTEGIEDPLYALNSFGLVKRQVFVNTSPVFGPDAVSSAISLQWYVPSNSSPGFLERLEGKTYLVYASDGMESLVNVEDFITQGLSIKANQSHVDYLYFNETTPNGFTLNATGFAWPLFNIDEENALKYGVEAYLET
ncbi:MAG: hypothetical protein ABH803_00130 [Candidatus Micrarchaeota archaeon]